MLSMALFAGPACAGRVAPVYNVVDHPIPVSAQKLPLTEIEKNIMAAGAQHQWQCEELGPGSLHASFTHGSHQVVVAIAFSQTAYSITLVSSVNMKQEGDEIHRKYNQWVRTLEEAIASRLTLAGVAAK